MPSSRWVTKCGSLQCKCISKSENPLGPNKITLAGKSMSIPLISRRELGAEFDASLMRCTNIEYHEHHSATNICKVYAVYTVYCLGMTAGRFHTVLIAHWCKSVNMGHLVIVCSVLCRLQVLLVVGKTLLMMLLDKKSGRKPRSNSVSASLPFARTLVVCCTCRNRFTAALLGDTA